MNILISPQHELRSGWKFLAYWILFLAMLWIVLQPFPPRPQTQLERLVLNALPAFPALAALALMAKYIDKVPLASFGASLRRNWPRHIVLGIGISAGMLVIMTIMNATGGITMLWTGTDATGGSLTVTVLVLVLSAAQEELLFRGYPLQVLMKGIGVWPAILTMSTAFGLVHLLNPNATILGAINTMLAGLMLSLAYLKTRSLWLPYGLHLGWNVGLGFVLGYPLSGIGIDSLWRTIARGPQWLVGGAYGPEGGLACTVAFVAACVAIRSNKIHVPEN